MANKTVPDAQPVHGGDPQFIIEKILRNKILESQYWKEHCFALTAESLVDKAVELEYIGGTYGGNRKPTPFMCLILKMLQIQPEREIIHEFIKNDDYKYVRLLGAFYLRLVGKPVEIYMYLEPLLNDYRKVRFREPSGKVVIKHIDEIVDDMLTKDHYLDIALPFLIKRHILEAQGKLPPRESALHEIEARQRQIAAEQGIEVNEDEEEDSEDESVNPVSKRQPKKPAADTKDAKDDKDAKDAPQANGKKEKEKEDKEKERESSRSRRSSSRGRERSRERETRSRRSRSRERDRRRSRSRSSSRGRRRSRSRSRGRDRRRSRSSSRDRRRDRRRSRSRSSSRDRGRNYDRDRDRDRGTKRKRSRSRSRD